LIQKFPCIAKGIYRIKHNTISFASTVFPIDVEITIGSKKVDCPGGMPDYYEIKEFTVMK